MFLDIKDLHVRYGSIEAIRGISFDLIEREVVTIIGANGAGKSTILRAIMGINRVFSGTINTKFGGKFRIYRLTKSRDLASATYPKEGRS